MITTKTNWNKNDFKTLTMKNYACIKFIERSVSPIFHFELLIFDFTVDMNSSVKLTQLSPLPVCCLHGTVTPISRVKSINRLLK